MEISHSAADKSGFPASHTLLGLFWIGTIYVLSWKPELLGHLLAGSKSFAAAVVALLEAAPIL